MKRQFWGLVLIILGVLVFMQTQLDYKLGLSFWPVVGVMFGFGILWSSFKRTNWFGLALGLWIFAMSLSDILFEAGVSPVDSGDIMRNGWPVILVAIGVSLIFGKRAFRFSYTSDGKSTRRTGVYHGHVVGEVRHGQSRWTLDKDLHLEHGVGDLRVDLTTADITEGEHKIVVQSGIGDVVVRVPDNVNVIATGTVGLGDLEVLGSRRSGVGNNLSRTIVVEGSPVTLIIEAKLGLGDLDIVQRPAMTPTFKATIS